MEDEEARIAIGCSISEVVYSSLLLVMEGTPSPLHLSPTPPHHTPLPPFPLLSSSPGCGFRCSYPLNYHHLSLSLSLSPLSSLLSLSHTHTHTHTQPKKPSPSLSHYQMVRWWRPLHGRPLPMTWRLLSAKDWLTTL